MMDGFDKGNRRKCEVDKLEEGWQEKGGDAIRTPPNPEQDGEMG